MDLHIIPPRPGQPSSARPLSPVPLSPSSPRTSRLPLAPQQPQPHRFAHIQEVLYDEKAGLSHCEDPSKTPADRSPIAGPSSLPRSQVASPISSIPPWIRSQRIHHPRSSQLHQPFSPAPCPIASSWASPSISSASSSSSISHSYTRPRGLRIANLIKPWIPIILYVITTLGFLAAVSFWKVEVFQGEHMRHSLHRPETLPRPHTAFHSSVT